MENGSGLTKADLITALSEMRIGLKKEIVDELSEKIQATRDELTGQMRQIETTLLPEFHRYGKGQQLRLHTLESRESLVTERLAIIEERLLHLESRRPPTF